jgi:zinc protease
MTNRAELPYTGPKLLVEPSADLPLVSVSVALRTGALEDPPEAEGAVRLLARLMRRSAGGRGAEENDALIERIGASLGAEVSHSAVVFQGAVISRSLERFAEFFVEALGQPSLPEAELDRLKRETEAELVETLDDDRGLGRRWFRRRMFEGHPYARSASGTLSGVKNTTPAILRALYEKMLVPENLVISLSGDVTEARAETFAKKLAGSLRSGPARIDDTPHPSMRAGRRLVFVDKPERTQTQILIGGLGSHPKDPDHVALSVANTAFGGTFTARLMQEVRVKRGWSYGAYSSLPIDRRRQAFSLWTFPKASDAAACIELELELLKAFRERGITKSELSWAKRYLIRSHVFAVDTAAKRAGLALDTELYDLPADYYTRYLDHVKAVTLEQANAAVQMRISDENLLVSVVGTESMVGAAVKNAIPNLVESDVVRYDAE